MTPTDRFTARRTGIPVTHKTSKALRKGGLGLVQVRHRHRFRPSLLALEERTLLSTFTVTSTLDDGSSGSLRWAITQANNGGDDETIQFDSTAFSTPQTITLTQGQLELSATTGSETITGPAAGVTVSGNNTSRVFQVDGNVTSSMTRLTITGGLTSGRADGAGLSIARGGSTTLTDCTISGNRAVNGAAGGGLFNLGTATLTYCAIRDNIATYSGAGMLNGGTITATNCTVSGNGGTGGAGLQNTDGFAVLTNCTFSGNSSGGPGGGIFTTGDFTGSAGRTALINCTVSGNAGSRGGGLDSEYFGITSLTNTIVAGNQGDIASGNSGSNNLIGGNLIGGNPLLAPLGNFGGPTQTMALLPGSPAIDAGTSGPNIPTTDQRGADRAGTVDIGAFESQGFTFAAVSGSTPQTSDIGVTFTNPLAVTVTANNPVEPVDGGVVGFVTNPAANGASAIFSAHSAEIASGLAAITAAPDNVLGSYTVAANAGALSVTFDLTNTGNVLSALVVNTTSDSVAPGPGLVSLREAVTFLNTGPSGTATISFDPTVFAAAQTITLTTSQLELTQGNITITGPDAGVTVSGGGLTRVFQVDAGVTASISGMTITGGSASNGGGLYNSGTLTLRDCTLSGNTASQFGGGLFSSGGSATLTNCTVTRNAAALYGGGVENRGVIALTNCTVSGNSANQNVGGLDQHGGTATLIDCTLSGNAHGGLANSGGTIALTNCTVGGNSGGGLTTNSGVTGTATLTNCTVSDNGGTGIVNFVGTATLLNCTISGNTSFGAGGMDNGFGGQATLTNCTIFGNTTTGVFYQDGGMLDIYADAATLINCIVSGNTNGDLYSYYGSFDLENTIVGGDHGDPRVGPLGYCGGPTKTMPLLPGSPAIGAGADSGITTDQRGLPLDSPIDIGAFQVQSGPIVVNTNVDGEVTPVGQLNLRQAVRLANVLGGNQTITFDPTVFATAQTITLTDGQLELSDTTGTETITGPAVGLTISGNNAGRVFQVDSGVTAGLRGLTITGGNAVNGGGLYDSGGTVDLNDCTVSGNSATGNGGGLFAYLGTITLSGSTVSGNSATGIGNASFDDAIGGGLCLEFGTATLSNCMIDNNTAPNGSGGGMALLGNMATLTNCTVSGNSATGNGGGLFTTSLYNSLYGQTFAGTTTLTNCTVSGNSATGNGGGLYNNGTTTLQNTIVAGNTGSGSSASDIEGSVASTSSFNLIGTGGSGGLINAVDGNLVGVANPGLESPADNGGPTESVALLPGSPAIDAGNDALIPAGVITDGRGIGYPRSNGTTVDIGAFEYGSGQSQTISFGALASQTYGATHSVNLTASSSSNLPVSFAIISGPATISAGVLTITAGAGAGNVVVEAFQAGNSLYAGAALDQTLTVNTATLTITPDAGQSKAYGAAVPAVTATATGFAGGDSYSLLTGAPGTLATASSAVGTYAFTLGSLTAGLNYTLVLATSSPTLAVTPAQLIIMPGAGQSKVYGSAVPAVTATATGFASGDSSSLLTGAPGTMANASSAVGTYAFTLGSLTVGPNYTLVLATSATFGVTPASLVITAQSASTTSGQLLPVLTASYTGFVNGDSPASLTSPASIVTTATSASPAGAYPILVQGSSSLNYTITRMPGTLTVTNASTILLSASLRSIKIAKNKMAKAIVLVWSAALSAADALNKANLHLSTVPSSKKQKPVSVPIGQVLYQAGTTSLSLVTKKPLNSKVRTQLTINSSHLHDINGNLVINSTSGQPTVITVVLVNGSGVVNRARKSIER
jgi:hypothetical protein